MSTLRVLLFIFINAFFLNGMLGQINPTVQDTLSFPSLNDGDYYREDQLFFNFSALSLLNKSEGLQRSGFSYNITTGYYRDVPINKRGSLAFAMGAAYRYYSLQLFNQPGDSQEPIVVLPDGQNLENISLKIHSIQLPVEFRWRSSTATKYTFWRIYTGFSFNYLMVPEYKFTSNQTKQKLNARDQVRNWEYGPHLNVGYGFWNFHMFYSMTGVFDDELQMAQPWADVNYLELGISWYIF